MRTDENTGIGNNGYYNTGDCNIGDCNTGIGNKGSYNSGHLNAGSFNAGSFNAGDFNTGHFNAGSFNTGDYNTGSYNSGYFNKGDWCCGICNTTPGKIRMFNRETNLSMQEITRSRGYHVLEFIFEQAEQALMASLEKSKDSSAAKPGTVSRKEHTRQIQAIYDRLSEADKKAIRSLPNFDAEIFKECTGIIITQ